MTNSREFIYSVITKIFIPVLLFLTFAVALIVATRADADGWEHGERGGHEWGERHEYDDDHYDDDDDDDDDRGLFGRRRPRGEPLAVSAAYNDECSGCHMAYQPWLMPARSWEKLIDGAGDHFGEDLDLDGDVAGEIRAYLVDNSAENTGVRNEWTGRRGKIMQRLEGKTPMSIGEIPYIKKEHRRLRSKVFKRPSIMSFSNCGACHKTAGEGDYEEDNIRIPKR